VASFQARVDLPGIGEHDRIYHGVSDGHESVFAAVLVRGEATLAAQRGALAQLLLSLKPARSAGVAAGVAAAGGEGGQSVGGSSAIPYGGKPVNMLDRAFRPSGRGQPFPLPAIVDGRPVGPWWFVRVQQFGSTHRDFGSSTLSTYVFFPDGTATALFRPGGPQSADLDGMRAIGEDGFIGRYEVSGGVLNLRFGPNERDLISKPMTIKQSGGDTYFLWWQREYQPALPALRSFVIG
jgi:hypothetical protein